MKLYYDDMQQFYKTVSNAKDVIKDDYGNIVAFNYMKYYGSNKRSGKLIRVSLKSEKEIKKSPYIYLHEKPFFNLLADNVDSVTDVKLHCEKIYKFTLKDKKYKTDKSNTKKLFDFMPYTEFMKVTRQRFYDNDEMLRSGYFSGLIGTNDDNILKYKAAADEYELFDVDFNAAYPYCLNMPMPCGRFYTADEWKNIAHDGGHMKFYQIQIKTLKNPFKVFIAPQPYIEYRDFDFLLSKVAATMVVSEYRLDLINRVYGNNTYIIKKEYYCKTKIYVSLTRFAAQLYDDIQAAKKSGNAEDEKQLKIALNSLIGQFGRRDETKGISGLRLIDNGITDAVIIVDWDKAEDKQQRNYLPLAMTINDITALRLFRLMIDENVLRLCYNTDGGIIAVKKGCRIVTSERIGRLKAKRIHKPEFYYCTMLYNRPLVYDVATNRTYNAKAISYDIPSGNFIYRETARLNTRDGFILHKEQYPLAVEVYRPFNFRLSELIIKLSKNKLYRELYKKTEDELTAERLKGACRAFEKLSNPYDSDYNEIRYAPKYKEIREQLIFNEKFFKNT